MAKKVKKRIKEGMVRKVLFEQDGLLLLIAFITYGLGFVIAFGVDGVVRSTWKYMFLPAYILLYGLLIAAIVVLIVELIIFIKTMKKSPKKVDYLAFIFTIVAIMLPFLLIFIVNIIESAHQYQNDLAFERSYALSHDLSFTEYSIGSRIKEELVFYSMLFFSILNIVLFITVNTFMLITNRKKTQ